MASFCVNTILFNRKIVRNCHNFQEMTVGLNNEGTSDAVNVKVFTCCTSQPLWMDHNSQSAICKRTSAICSILALYILEVMCLTLTTFTSLFFNLNFFLIMLTLLNVVHHLSSNSFHKLHHFFSVSFIYHYH